MEPSSVCFDCVGYGYRVRDVVVPGKAFVFAICRNCGGNGYVLTTTGLTST